MADTELVEYSPADLPEQLADHLGTDNLDAFEMWIERYKTLKELHMTMGIRVRNTMRKLGCSWRDVDLDDGWERVAIAAMDFRRKQDQHSARRCDHG